MKFLSRASGITEKEWPRARSMMLLCFAIMAALAFGRAARDAFFIKNAGADNLPIVYLLNGILVAGIAAVYSRVVHRLSLSRFMGLLCAAFVLAIVVLRLLISSGNVVMPYAVWSLAEVYNILMLMHFWTYANKVFDPREGKRMFPIVGAAGLVGMIVGSSVTPMFVNAFGSNNLLLGWAGMVVLAIPPLRLSAAAARKSGVILAGTDDSGETVAENWRSLFQIPLVRTLAMIAFPMWITAWLVDYQFFHALDEVYKEQDALAGFLGVFNGLSSLAGLILQFFVTGRLLQTLGVGGTSILYPGVVAASAVGLCARSVMPVVPGKVYEPRSVLGIAGKFSDETLFGSVHDSAIAVLFSSLPDENRARARALLNGAMEPVATAVAGVLLLVLGRFHAPPIVFASLTLTMCIVWIGLALRIKKDYLRALVANLNSRNIDLQRNAFSLLSTNRDLETREILLAALSSNDEDMALFALELLDHPDLATALRLSAVLPHTTPRLKTALLGYLGRAGFSETRTAIRTEVSDPDGPVRAAAVRALSLVGGREDVRSVSRLIKDTHANVAAEAVIAQLTRPGGQRTVGTKGLDRLLRSREEAERFQAARVLREVPLPAKAKSLVRLMEHSTPDVRNEAVRAMGMLKTREALRLLAAYLREDDVYLSAKEGLLQYGESALSALHAQLAIETEAEAKLSIVACIGEISSLRSIPVLAKLIVRQPILVENAAAEALTNIRMKFLVETGQDVSRADEYFTREVKDRIRSCYFSVVENIERDRQNIAILQKASDPTAVLLILDAVQRFARQRLEVALKFLELIGDPRTIRALTADLQFGDARGRAEALEALEGSCTEAGVLVRVLEDDPTQASRGTVDEVLRHILWKNHPPWITSCAVHAAGLLNMKMLEPELFSQLDAPDEMVRINASIALRKLKSKTFRLTVQKERNHKHLERERKKMDTRMERFLFLRSVPLFSEVDGVDLHWINEITHEQKFRARANIFREGDPGESMYIIISGSVRIFKGQKGKELTIDILQERDCFGEMAILDQEPRSASVVAVRNTRLLVINRSDFQRLLIARPRISFALFKTMSRRVREANARLIQLQKVV